MTKRLDVAAAIALVGEDRIREELDKNTWYIQLIDISSRSRGNPFQRIEIHSHKRFITPENPIEYLLYNDIDFFRYIALKLCDKYDPNEFEDVDDYMTAVIQATEEDMEIPIAIADFLWKLINTFSHAQIKNLFLQDNLEVYILYDKEFRQMLPVTFYAEEFFNKWFPR